VQSQELAKEVKSRDLMASVMSAVKRSVWRDDGRFRCLYVRVRVFVCVCVCLCVPLTWLSRNRRSSVLKECRICRGREGRDAGIRGGRLTVAPPITGSICP
jgi:hypothetical protein